MKVSDITPATEERDAPHLERTLLEGSQLTPIEMYLTLRRLFGLPNCDFDVTRSQWAFFLRVPGGFINVYDWKIEILKIGVYADSGTEGDAREIGKKFRALLDKESQHTKKPLRSKARDADVVVLQNPYLVYYEAGANTESMARQEHNDELYRETPKEASLCQAAFLLFVAAFEGFLNLVYELYLRPDLKETRFLDRLSREQIDLKVLLAPVYCSCFGANVLPREDLAFSDLHSIMNRRNDFVHANLTKSMRRPVITEDGHRFLIEPPGHDEKGLPRRMSAVRLNDVEVTKAVIDRAITWIMENMTPRYKRELSAVLDQEWIQIATEDGEALVDAAWRDSDW